jgi:hypothetical protein
MQILVFFVILVAEASRGKPRQAEASRGKPRHNRPEAEASRGKPRQAEATRGAHRFEGNRWFYPKCEKRYVFVVFMQNSMFLT